MNGPSDMDGKVIWRISNPGEIKRVIFFLKKGEEPTTNILSMQLKRVS